MQIPIEICSNWLTSRCFSTAFVSSVNDPVERARKERKIANLLPLAILPDEEKKGSPSKGIKSPQLALSIGIPFG